MNSGPQAPKANNIPPSSFFKGKARAEILESPLGPSLDDMLHLCQNERLYEFSAHKCHHKDIITSRHLLIFPKPGHSNSRPCQKIIKVEELIIIFCNCVLV